MRRPSILTCALALLLAGSLGYVLAPRAEAASRPPIVMVVFDEFPSTSLLDRRGHIDAARYPNFAALANGGTWFKNATASVDETGRATETILTGSQPPRKRPVTLQANPRNLFTLLGRRYRMDASEEVTSLCPKRLCPRVRAHNRSSILHELAGGRPERFESWVRSIGRTGRPTLFFKHALLPHVPLRYLPTGNSYSRGAHETIRGIVENFHDRWLIKQAYQRHLLQLGFSDRLLGSLLRRLRGEGLYDRSLIVVTADNGESFGRVGNRHEISRGNAGDIALTPLFVKLPGQQRGRVVSRHVRTVDVLPTVARLAGVRVPWRTQGRSLFGPGIHRIPSGVTMFQRSGHRFRLSYGSLQRRRNETLRRQVRWFGSGGSSPTVHGIGPHPVLIGQPTVLWPVTRARRVQASIHDPGAFHAVNARSGFVPCYVTGRILGDRRGRHRDLAIAVNGWIVATAPSFYLQGYKTELYSVVMPEESLRPGSNRVQVFSIDRRRDGLHLVALN